MLDPTTRERIRAIFLHPERDVTIEDAAAMLGRPAEEIEAAIAAGDIETIQTCSGARIETREVAEQATHIWSFLTIEAALGKDAQIVFPNALRSSKLTVRLPSYLIQSLYFLADENGEDVDSMLTREVHGLALAGRDRLARRIVEFDDCIDWPVIECSQAS
jgi:hypothetical protein